MNRMQSQFGSQFSADLLQDCGSGLGLPIILHCPILACNALFATFDEVQTHYRYVHESAHGRYLAATGITPATERHPGSAQESGLIGQIIATDASVNSTLSHDGARSNFALDNFTSNHTPFSNPYLSGYTTPGGPLDVNHNGSRNNFVLDNFTSSHITFSNPSITEYTAPGGSLHINHADFFVPNMLQTVDYDACPAAISQELPPATVSSTSMPLADTTTPALKRHHSSQTPTTINLRCARCFKAFKRRYDLRRHEKIHSNERPFQCPEPGCRYSGTRRDKFIEHRRKKHGHGA
ncbi:MAG: hypothetical protein M1834_007976 [Cirrosporium novae-zelandiae]|nr:MAG: hypothetical protein M1834_007976 [Cirrosporium novae-zelandiae]